MKIQLKRSNVLESGNAKVPTSAQLDYGELAVNYNADDPTLFLKDSNDNVIKFGGTSAYDDRYVQRAGDNMTGDLTFGADGAATPAIALNVSGSATFAGDVQLAGDAKAGEAGIKLEASGLISAARAGNGVAVFGGYNAGSSTATSYIRNDGEAMFSGVTRITTETGSPVSGAAKGVEINPTGRVTCAKPSGNAESDQVFSGFAVGNATATTKIFSDGSAKFADVVKVGDYDSTVGSLVSPNGGCTVKRNSVGTFFRGLLSGVEKFKVDESGGATFASGNTEILDSGALRIKRSIANGALALGVFPDNDFTKPATAVINTTARRNSVMVVL